MVSKKRPSPDPAAEAAPVRRRSRDVSEGQSPKRGKPTGRPRRDGVDALQHRGIVALLNHSTQKAAAAAIGVSERTMTRWFEEKAFRDEYFKRLDELLAEQWSAMVAPWHEIWERFMTLVRSENDAIALRAVTWYLDYMARRLPTLTWRPAEDDVAMPARLREMYEELEGQPEDTGDDAA